MATPEAPNRLEKVAETVRQRVVKSTDRDTSNTVAASTGVTRSEGPMEGRVVPVRVEKREERERAVAEVSLADTLIAPALDTAMVKVR